MLESSEIGWLKQFNELRKRVIISFVFFALIFTILIFFSKSLYSFLAIPLLKTLPHGSSMVAISVASPIFVPIKFAFYVAILLSLPFSIYQLWRFISPGLYVQERLLIWPVLLLGFSLFGLGLVFAYFIVFPMLFQFFSQALPTGVVMMTDISAYLSFVLRMFLAFGLAFEIPLVVVLLTLLNLVSEKQLKQFRPYAIIFAFILGMLLSPPDVLSQTMLAIPIWFLFELGVLGVKLVALIFPKRSMERFY